MLFARSKLKTSFNMVDDMTEKYFGSNRNTVSMPGATRSCISNIIEFCWQDSEDYDPLQERKVLDILY